MPAYLSVLEDQAKECVERLRAAAREDKIALVDQYKHDIRKVDAATHGAFSHACVLRDHLLGIDPLRPPQRAESTAARAGKNARKKARKNAARNAARKRRAESPEIDSTI